MIKINDRVKLKESCDAVKLGYCPSDALLKVNNVIEREGSNPWDNYKVLMVGTEDRINVAVYEHDVERVVSW